MKDCVEFEVQARAEKDEGLLKRAGNRWGEILMETE